MKALLPQWPYQADKKAWKNFQNYIFDITPGDIASDEGEMHELWFRLRTVLSLLVAGDRLDAVNVESANFRALPDYTAPDFPGNSAMNKWRAGITADCARNAMKISEPGIFTLTLPTGSGKTNIGLLSAHIIARNLGYGTIIYAMPFISIIEQNAAFAEKVFGPAAVQEDHSLMLARDDDDECEADGDDLKNWRRVRRLFRYWNSPVVVTTMVQLWETIFSPRASASIDFHRLSRAVVIMDEPQGISPHLWREFGEALAYLSEKFGTAFIFMTATQPEILKLDSKDTTPNGVKKVQELAPDVTLPFKRHRYKFLSEKYKIADLPNLLKAHVPFYEKSGLIILNTRKSALEAFRLISREIPDASVYMLSSWMTPAHRRSVIQEIKNCQDPSVRKRHYVVSTQVVEAGVDLDFDWVFRDVGPLDSIVQAAGRCNRSALRDEGTIVIAELCDERKDGALKSFAGMIYDQVPLHLTNEILAKRREFDDGDVSEIISAYYKELTGRLEQRKVWENIRCGKWGSYTPLFRKDSFDVQIYVDMDEDLDDLLSELRAIDKSLENRERLKSINNKLQQYAIGVNKNYLSAWLAKIGTFITDSVEKLEPDGDERFIIRISGIGDGDGYIYDKAAGFQPLEGAGDDDFC
jgi:CRISPR-associated endonuclease/helicase Cas3